MDRFSSKISETRALTLAQFFEIRYSKSFRVFAGMMGFGAGLVNFGNARTNSGGKLSNSQKRSDPHCRSAYLKRVYDRD